MTQRSIFSYTHTHTPKVYTQINQWSQEVVVVVVVVESGKHMGHTHKGKGWFLAERTAACCSCWVRVYVYNAVSLTSERQLKLVQERRVREKQRENERDQANPARSCLPLAVPSLTVTVNSYSHSHDRVTFLFLPPCDLANRSPVVAIKVTTDQ